MGILAAAFFILLGIVVQRLVIDPRGFVRDGALLICENSEKIFLFKEGILHALPQDVDLIQQLGFNITRITEVSCEVLEKFPEGEPVEEMIVNEIPQTQIIYN